MEIDVRRWARLAGNKINEGISWPEEDRDREDEESYKEFRGDLEKAAWLRGEDMEKFMSPRAVAAAKDVVSKLDDEDREAIEKALGLDETDIHETAGDPMTLKKALKNMVQYVKDNPVVSHLAAGMAAELAAGLTGTHIPDDIKKLYILGLGLSGTQTISNFMGPDHDAPPQAKQSVPPGPPRNRRIGQLESAFIPVEILQMIMEQAAELDDLDDYVLEMVVEDVPEEVIEEAKKKGKKHPLGKVMKGDVKKYKVYVKDKKTGNVKKVNFGDPNMEIRRDNPKARKSFRARHGCGTPRASDRTKAAYWACRLWSKKPVSKILRGK